jgi:hypothetical protein
MADSQTDKQCIQKDGEKALRPTYPGAGIAQRLFQLMDAHFAQGGTEAQWRARLLEACKDNPDGSPSGPARAFSFSPGTGGKGASINPGKTACSGVTPGFTKQG